PSRLQPPQRPPPIPYTPLFRSLLLPRAASGWSIIKRMAPRNILFGFRSSFPSPRTKVSARREFAFRGAPKRNGRQESPPAVSFRSEEHTSELQSRFDLVCRLLL